MNRPVGIKSFGGYVPWLRLERSAIADNHAWFDPSVRSKGKGQRAISNWDEDALTLAVEAARRCGGAGFDGRIGRAIFASTTAPFADRQNAGIIKEALNLPDSIETLDVSGSRRAGTSALLAALHAARGDGVDVLCASAEKPRTQPLSEAEFTAGDGAAALWVGAESLAAEFIGSHTASMDFVDQFRGANREFDYVWESRWVREEGYGKIVVAAIRAAFEKTGVDAKEVKHFLLEAPVAGVAARAAKLVGVPDTAVHRGLAAEVGFAGSAAPLIQLVHALEGAGPDEIVVLVGFGQGCDVLIFKTTASIAMRLPTQSLRECLRAGKATSNYMRYLVINDYMQIERGMRAEMDMKTALTTLYRDRKTIFGLVGARDRNTGTVQYPRSEIPLGSSTGQQGDWEDYLFADRAAKVLSFTADRLAFSIDPPGYYGMLDFEGGGRMTVDFTDMDPADAIVGRPMRMAFRVKGRDTERGFVRYFWKGVPQR
jgi:3-hydroxy-3-methylglutaryl CoA synthase